MQLSAQVYYETTDIYCFLTHRVWCNFLNSFDNKAAMLLVKKEKDTISMDILSNLEISTRNYGSIFFIKNKVRA